MIRTMAQVALAGVFVIGAGLISCSPPHRAHHPANEAFDQALSTDSAIAGVTLVCARDYPDSRLVFQPDGTLAGRYAGTDISGEWTALSPGKVAVLMRAGGLAVRDTMHRTEDGWQGSNTACG